MNTKTKTTAPKIPWKKIKGEFQKDEYQPCLCWGSVTFREIWGEENHREYIRSLATDFLKDNNTWLEFQVSKESAGYGKAVALFESGSKFNGVTYHKLRIDFLDYCIKRFAPIPWKKIYKEYMLFANRFEYICHVSPTFSDLWGTISGKQRIKDKASIFIKEKGIKDYIALPYGSDVLFAQVYDWVNEIYKGTASGKFELRRQFLEYCAAIN